MQTTVTIPEEVVYPTVVQFRLRPGEKDAKVFLQQNTGGEQISVTVNFQSVLDAATATQKNTVRQFFKRIAKLAFEEYSDDSSAVVDEGDITGEMFDDA
jgi:hypothetical protein